MPDAYRIWRRQLHELQQKFDAFEDSVDYENYDYEEYKRLRQPLVDALEAHYKKEGAAIEEDEA